IIAVLFKIQHRPFIYEMLFTAQAFSLIFWMCATAEAFMSNVLPAKSKYILSGALILLMIADLVVFVPLIFLVFQWGYLRLSHNKLYPVVQV
ncbi:MAG: hypothetical protein KDC07_12245, partial [Chitinophagaceae bacterium]|nr:hypothetical protein [Chitinophagaceae bacterium]